MPRRERLCSEQKAELSHTAEQSLGKKAQTPKSLRGNVWYLFNLEKSLKAGSVQTARNNLQYKNTEVRFDFRTLTLICLYTSTETFRFPQLTCSN